VIAVVGLPFSFHKELPPLEIAGVEFVSSLPDMPKDKPNIPEPKPEIKEIIPEPKPLIPPNPNLYPKKTKLAPSRIEFCRSKRLSLKKHFHPKLNP
jgi:hypothetical protein